MTENEAILRARKVVKDKRADTDWNWRNGRLNSDDCIKCAEEHEQLAKWLEELQQYRAIGTVEECREARERQRAKKPILYMNEKSGMFVDYADGHGECITQMNNWWRCPCCNEVVGQRVVVHKHIHDQRKKKYCEKCGQAIDWSDTP